MSIRILNNQVSIAAKLFIAIAGSSLLTAALAFAFLIPMEIKRLKQIDQDEVQVFIKTFNRDFIRVLLFNTTEESVNLTEHLREFPIVLSASLADKDGNTVFTYHRTSTNGHSFSAGEDTESHQIKETARYMGEDYGYISLTTSNARLNERIRQYYQLIFPLCVSLIIISFLLARVVRDHIARPIIKLSASVNEIAQNRQYEQRIHYSAEDEVGILYDGFNELLHTVSTTQSLLAREKEQAIFTLNSITDAVIRTDHLGKIEYMNPVAESMTQHEAKTATGMHADSLFSIITSNDKQQASNPLTECIRSNEIIKNKDDHMMVIGDDKNLDIEYSAAPVHGQNKNISGAVMVFKDVSQEREAARQLSFLASHDSLTGIYNRRTFEKHISRAISKAQNKNHVHTLFFMDLDKFKHINDTAGHLAGDEVLRNVAAILASNIRETDVLARLGGDEFGILLPSCAEDRGLIIAENIRAEIEAYRLNWEGKTYNIGICIGLVSITCDSKDLPDVINAADSACYVAKNDGRNCVRVYTADKNMAPRITHLAKAGNSRY